MPSAPGPFGSRVDRTGKPPIWSGGRQRPPFDGKSFWRVTLAGSRDLLVPLIERAAAGSETTASAVACGAGAAMVARLGRASRILPPRWAVVSAFRNAGLALGEASASVGRMARTEPVEALPLRGWAEAPGTAPVPPASRPRPARPQRQVAAAANEPAPEPEAVAAKEDKDAATDAVRALLDEANAAPVRPARVAAALPDTVAEAPALSAAARGAALLPSLAPPEPPVAGPGHRFAGWLLTYAFLALALPFGAAKAGIALARGEDLRLRET